MALAELLRRRDRAEAARHLRRERVGDRLVQAWQRESCPQAPADYSYRFLQVAHPDLVLPGLVGDETVRLHGLLPGGTDFAFVLPGVALVAHHEWFDGRAVGARLPLDGLHLDLRAPDGPWRVDLTWRGWVAQCPAYHGASLAMVRPAEAAELPGQGEYGLDLAEAAS